MVDKTKAVNSAYNAKVTNSTQQKSAEQLKAEHRKQGEYYVASGETLCNIAKNANMTLNDFKIKTGLTKDALQLGQIIKNIPTKAIKSGQGLQAFCRENNVDYHLFLALNCINDKYIAQPGEKFFMPATDKTTPKPAPTPEPSKKTTPEPKKDDSKKTISAQKYTVPASGYISVGADETHNVRVISGKPPVPTIQEGKKEKIVAEVIRFQPLKSNTGELKGKVIMVNAGHGYKEGYYEKNADLAFDPGKPDAKDANGKQIEEWRKNRDFAEDLINQLRAKGATVIFTTGSAKLACQAKKDHKCDMFISLHCNAVANKNKNGIEVYYTEADKKGKGFQLAQKVAKKLGVPNDNIKSDITTRHGKIGVITDIGPKYAPSILLEMGYMTNSKDIANIDSWKVRQDQMEQVTQAIVETFNPPKPKKK